MITIEPCPICEYQYAECEHMSNGEHRWQCDDCEDFWYTLPLYECPDCKHNTPKPSLTNGAKDV